MLAIELFFTGLYIIFSSITLVLILVAFLQFLFYIYSIQNKKAAIVTGISLGICIGLVYWIHDTFKIWIYINLSVFDNIFFEAMGVIVSLGSIFVVLYIFFQAFSYATGFNKRALKPLVFGIVSLGATVCVVFWVYQTLGILLYVDLRPYIY